MYDDDFDIDEGLDLDQFDYKTEPVSPRADKWDPRDYGDDYDNGSRYHAGDDEYGVLDERGYPNSRPYVAEYDDNIVFKSHPEYMTTPDEYARPVTSFPRSEAYRESHRSIKPNRDRYTSYEPSTVERRSTRKSFRSRPAQSDSVPHYEPSRDGKYHSQRPSSYYEPSRDEKYRSQRLTSNHEQRMDARYRSQRSSSRYEPSRDDKFRSQQPIAHSVKSDKYSMTQEWLLSENFERSTTRKSKREKVRKFPLPEPNAPLIPPPDYDDDDTSGVLYVPSPDYR